MDTNLRGAAVILTTGEFIRTDGHHDDLWKELFPENTLEGRNQLLQTAIKLNDGSNSEFESPYICMPPQKPTNEQFETLLNWLDGVMYENDYIEQQLIGHSVFCRFDFLSQSNEAGYSPEDIIKILKAQYEN